MFEEKLIGEKVAKLYIKMDNVDTILGVGKIEAEWCLQPLTGLKLTHFWELKTTNCVHLGFNNGLRV